MRHLQIGLNGIWKEVTTQSFASIKNLLLPLLSDAIRIMSECAIKQTDKLHDDNYTRNERDTNEHANFQTGKWDSDTNITAFSFAEYYIEGHHPSIDATNTG